MNTNKRETSVMAMKRRMVEVLITPLNTVVLATILFLVGLEERYRTEDFQMIERFGSLIVLIGVIAALRGPIRIGMEETLWQLHNNDWGSVTDFVEDNEENRQERFGVSSAFFGSIVAAAGTVAWGWGELALCSIG